MSKTQYATLQPIDKKWDRDMRWWDCYLGEKKIGRVMWKAERDYQYEKPFDGNIYTGQNGDGVHRAGWYNTLYAAKVGIMRCYQEWQREHDTVQAGKSAPVAYLPAADFEFYPTPSPIAGELFAGINWEKIHTILEPSAGKGDLLDFAMKVKAGERRHFGYSYKVTLKEEKPEIDCIELDENLRHILTGKEYRVVHDDFLTFRTRKRYDLILMNPPFSNGDLHLLRALELSEDGGQIACILNAETIRNPYTKTRQVLMKKLRECNARIRFVGNAFTKADRKADVEVALVNVEIQAAKDDTSIFDDLKKADRWGEKENMIETDIAPSGTVQRLIREYDVLCSVGIELMRKYNGVAKYIMSGKDDKYAKPIIGLSVGGHNVDHRCGNEDVNKFLEIARSRYWHELFDLPELRERMTSAMQSEYSDTVFRMKEYEFSEFNVQQVLDRIMAQLNEGVEDAILRCFDTLSNKHAYHEDIQNENIHYFNGWKTNKAHYVNKKCIIPTCGCFATSYKPDKHGRYHDVYTHIDPRSCFAVLDDLEKALDYLDKGETHRVNLARMLEMAANDYETKVSCKYFNVRFYKKGTCHIEFYDRSQKLLDRLNIYAARHRAWLPPTYGKVHYSDMDDESKRVVDDFLGKDHYETVMEKPSEYIIEGSVGGLLEDTTGYVTPEQFEQELEA